MKRFIAVSMAITIMLMCFSVYAETTGGTLANPDTSSWFAWEWPDDAKARGTAIDASFLMDAPAGKHGFAEVKGEHIYFGDGAEARFWGTNVSGDANFLEKAEAEKLANRIIRSGFNLVRFHHMDSNSWVSNIFGDRNVKPGITTRVLDKDQLDKLFYFMSKLKEGGVYFYVDGIVSRKPYPEDNIPFADQEYLSGFGFAKFFDPYLIELQKEYLNQLLTTVNPYTGLSLANDPAMVFMDITNESSLLGIGTTARATTKIETSYYLGQLQSKFNIWLSEKYQDKDELQKAWYEEGKVGLKSDEDFQKGTVFIDRQFNNMNFSTERVYDSRRFLYDLMTDYNLEMKSYIRDDLKVKSLLTGTGVGIEFADIPMTFYQTKQTMDYADQHAYKSHPNNYGFGTGSKITGWQSPTIVGGGELYRHWPWIRPYNQPFILGEWQNCSPGPYVAEGAAIQAIMACVQNWAPIQFDMIDSPIPEEGSPITSFFDTYDSADQTSIHPAAAMIFHRQDIKEAPDAYYKPMTYDDILDSDVYHSTPIGFENTWLYTKMGMMLPELDGDANDVTPEALERAYKKLSKNEPQSDELNWNRRSGIVQVNTPYTNAAIGFIGGKTVSLSYADITLDKGSASILLNSASKDSLADSKSILITTIARARNTGLVLDEADGATIINKGTGPMLIEPVNAQITIKTTSDIKVYALDSSGQRTREVPFERTADGYASFRVGAEYAAVYYEIVK